MAQESSTELSALSSAAASLGAGKGGGSGGGYIFEESEFDGSSFHAAAFVAKYRRVTSLESVRDQLRGYMQTVKDQLYEIINRDYKDFIEIATKLDGVDMRVHHLKKPLVDLRIEALSLHDGVVSALDGIRAKLRKKAELRQRRLQLETTLTCMRQFEEIDAFLTAKGATGRETVSSPGTAPLTRRQLMRHAAALSQSHSKSAAGDGGDKHAALVLLLEQQVMQASETERVAMMLSSAHASIARLLNHHKELSAATGKSSAGVTGVSLNAGITELRERAKSLDDQVSKAAHDVLYQTLIGIQATASTDASTGAENADARALRCRIFGHGLRALAALQRGSVASSLIAESVVYPLARNLLTQGRVDATGGRGFYAGLQEILMQVLTSLRAASGVADFLVLSEQVFCDETHRNQAQGAAVTDVLVHGVWKPVAAVLAERFAGMLSVGVAVAMHRAYSAVEHFIASLAGSLLLPPEGQDAQRQEKVRLLFGGNDQGPSNLVASATNRVLRHADVIAFRNKWKLDIYFQLRRQEITTRFDYVLAQLSSGSAEGGKCLSLHSSSRAVLDAVYFSTAAPASLAQPSAPAAAPSPKVPPKSPHPGASTTTPTAAVATAVVTLPAYMRTLTSEQANEILQAMEGYYRKNFGNRFVQLHMFQACLIEIGTCLHPSVFLSPLVGPFTALIVQLMMRLEAQICAAFPQISSPSFPNREAMLKSLASLSSGSVVSTSAGTVLSVEDIVTLLSDMKLMSQWMQSQLKLSISSSFEAGYAGFKHLRDIDISSEIVLSAHKALASQSRKYGAVSAAVWSRALALLSADCKVALQQVKGVAGKYRMTNKPPPDAPSPFVAAILKPIKEFLQRHGEDVAFVLTACNDSTTGDSGTTAVPAAQWQAEIVEDVTGVYVQQVQALIETAKQMDSALMRRAKNVSAATSGTAGMTDSEKIALQMIFDIQAFETEVKAVGITDPRALPAFVALFAQIDDMKRSFENLPQ